ncbi:alpha/beta hydrolase [Pseudoroseomonas cervicalis]|uniref:Palmitoyl-protein thioesterase ABHD10, mitochondrial n=1 Tax=Pseudoroseomonas cervicalis ATCC 49957 TaxID=525371 RepID=D5RSN7_9PROT|nr:alpha/beta hydrolase [Pseudoroseomonas cervicalis]EFH09686.1 hydrolase, alpha/beta domain protein [Pseudoroseomonas cervicalis ATCC 49957]
MSLKEETGRLDRGDDTELAWARLPGRGPTVVFLTGFRSDMEGSKAIALRDACAARGQSFLRFDYSGHGASGGRFEEGCIGEWASDAAAVLEKLTEGELVLVGSSMGGWISMLMLRRFPERVRGFLGIAAAPDFTRRLMWPAFSEAQRETLLREGVLWLDSPYGPPVPITRRLIEDGDRQSVLDRPLDFSGRVRLLQGMRDAEVPWSTAADIAATLTTGDLRIILVKTGQHRLAEPEELALLTETLAEFL